MARAVATVAITALALSMAPAPLSGSSMARGSGAGGVAARGGAWSDFNGDGYSDLAVGVPHESIGGTIDAGAVNVLYGSASGVASPGNQIWHQDTPGVKDTVQTDDEFGQSLAAGDFDNDGYSDLAVGVPHERVTGHGYAGAVHVLYGSAGGLQASNDDYWHLDVFGVKGAARFADRFGVSLAAGDFDNDGYWDLAIGASGRKVSGHLRAGSVSVLYGSPSGLTALGDQFWHQDQPGVLERPEEEDLFGEALAAGDFNADGNADLAVGVPNETVAGEQLGGRRKRRVAGGAAHVLYGSAAGLTAAADQVWSQSTPGVKGRPEPDDRFAWSLTAGDFNRDRAEDLAIGVPWEGIGGDPSVGAVNVLYGSLGGLSAAGDQLWHQGVAGVLGVPRAGEKFGRSVAAGDFDNDGSEDLAVGVPDDEKLNEFLSGAVNVLYGSATGLTAAGDQYWHQDQPGVKDRRESDRYGRAVSVADFDGDAFGDLAVGIPQESVRIRGKRKTVRAGAVSVLYGSAPGLTADREQLWSQAPLRGVPEEGDGFGRSLPPT